MKERIIKFGQWLKSELKDKNTAILFCFVVGILYSPVWCGYLLYSLFHWRVCFVVASAYLAFWAGPFTPFFPVCIAITLSLKKIMEKWKEKKEARKTDKPKENDVPSESVSEPQTAEIESEEYAAKEK